MANPTTNYGFVLPTSSDLVTDLPADFDVALQGVDTRLKALQPGTTLGDLAYSSATANTNTRLPIGTNGQVLAVSGGVPAWTTTSDVTPLTTKGDLFTFTTVDARLGIGANNTVLTADSAEATGMKWATPASGGMTVLASGSLSGASLDLTSISGSYVNLVLVLLGYAPSTNTGYGQLRFNNDSNTRYTQTDNNNVGAFNTFGATRIDMSDGMSNTSTNQSTVIEIQNYSDTSIWKRCTTDTIYTSTADGSNTKWRRSFYYGIYNQSTAIDRLTITPTGGFVSQGTYVLYGVK